MRRLLALTAGALAVAGMLRRMISELRGDDGLNGPTSVVLDAAYVAHIGAVIAVARRDHPVPAPPTAARLAGATAIATGASLLVAGMRRFPSEAQVNARDDVELVTDGVYRYSRHPQYLGWSLVLAGIAVAGRSPRALGLAALYPAALAVWLPHEEQHLVETFGDDYRAYRCRTPRWWGGSVDASVRERHPQG